MTNNKTANKQHVIDVASQLFFEQGFVYTSMDEIVRASKVSKSNVYYHFANKDELLLAVIDHWMETYRMELESALSRVELSVEERITLFLSSLATGIESRGYQGGCPFITLSIQAPNEETKVKEKITAFFAQLTIICGQLIQEGIEKNEFSTTLDPNEVANLFITNLEGALFLAEVKKDNQIITTTAKQLFTLLR